MRTLILIAIGLIVTVVLFWRVPRPRHRLVALLFSIAWFIVCAFNLRTGLSHGYTIADELPIHLMLFSVPAATAWLIAWRSRTSQNKLTNS